MGLAHETKHQTPQIEIWNIINQWSFHQIFNVKPPGTNAKHPYRRLSGYGLHFCTSRPHESVTAAPWLAAVLVRKYSASDASMTFPHSMTYVAFTVQTKLRIRMENARGPLHVKRQTREVRWRSVRCDAKANNENAMQQRKVSATAMARWEVERLLGPMRARAAHPASGVHFQGDGSPIGRMPYEPETSHHAAVRVVVRQWSTSGPVRGRQESGLLSSGP